jgi:hypothetical protein
MMMKKKNRQLHSRWQQQTQQAPLQRSPGRQAQQHQVSPLEWR